MRGKDYISNKCFNLKNELFVKENLLNPSFYFKEEGPKSKFEIKNFNIYWKKKNSFDLVKDKILKIVSLDF